MSEESVEAELRERAIITESTAEQLVSLAAVWDELTSGRAHIVDSFVAERCYVILSTDASQPSRTQLNARQRSMLEALLCGRDNKTVAYDFDVTPSTVSQAARQALQALGVDRSPGRACPLLALAAQAHRGLDRHGRTALLNFEGRELRVVGAARPDDLLAPLLPPAQYAVVRGLLEGRAYVEIARHRGTSTRTVANQLAAVFRRIGVSGRGSLLHHLISNGNVQLRSA